MKVPQNFQNKLRRFVQEVEYHESLVPIVHKLRKFGLCQHLLEVELFVLFIYIKTENRNK